MYTVRVISFEDNTDRMLIYTIIKHTQFTYVELRYFEKTWSIFALLANVVRGFIVEDENRV